jgi:hypothetical protein
MKGDVGVETPGSRRTWSWSSPRGVLVAILLGVQVLVPLAATINGIPSKLGFHMFVGYEPWTVSARDAAGETIEVDPQDWLIVPREDVVWAERIGPVICDDIDQAVEVVVRQRSQDVVVPCER